MVWHYTTTDNSSTTYITTADDYLYNSLRNCPSTAFSTISPWQTYTQTYAFFSYLDYFENSGTYSQSQYPRRLEIVNDQRNDQDRNQINQQQNQKSPEQLRQEADAKERAKREEAEITERAKNLLLQHLDNENKQRYIEKKPLEIVSKLFENIKYHVPISKLGRIKAWKESKVITELCLLVREGEHLPVEDVILTKLLYILHDERNMLKTANHSNVEENLLAGLN